MFNEEIKERYIAEKITTVIIPEYFLRHIFSLSEPFEEKLEKDVSNFTTYEILDMYKTLNFNSYFYLRNVNSQFSTYSGWCVSENLVIDCQNHFLEINKDLITKCINQAINSYQVVSRDTVINWCDSLPNPSDSFLLLALFEGIYGKDYEEIYTGTADSINGNIFHTNTGRDVVMSDRLLYYANRSLDTDVYYSLTGKLKKQVDFTPSDKIIKDYPNIQNASPKHQGRRIYRKTIRIFSYLGVDKYMNTYAIINSGILYYVNKKAKELGITGREFLYSDYMEEIRNQYSIRIVRSDFEVKYADYLYKGDLV